MPTAKPQTATATTMRVRVEFIGTLLDVAPRGRPLTSLSDGSRGLYAPRIGQNPQTAAQIPLNPQRAWPIQRWWRTAGALRGQLGPAPARRLKAAGYKECKSSSWVGPGRRPDGRSARRGMKQNNRVVDRDPTVGDTVPAELFDPPGNPRSPAAAVRWRTGTSTWRWPARWSAASTASSGWSTSTTCTRCACVRPAAPAQALHGERGLHRMGPGRRAGGAVLRRRGQRGDALQLPGLGPERPLRVVCMDWLGRGRSGWLAPRATIRWPPTPSSCAR